MAGKQGSIWYGFLEAGEKRSPVVRDATLETGNPATVYIFNLNKGRILEYRRDIVERKLRDLNPEEKGLKKTLKLELEKARTGFIPRGVRRPATKQQPRPDRDEIEIPDIDDADTDTDRPIFDEQEIPEDDDD